MIIKLTLFFLYIKYSYTIFVVKFTFNHYYTASLLNLMLSLLNIYKWVLNGKLPMGNKIRY